MRKYVQPAVESEEMLEQTSLACNVTNLAEQTATCMRAYRKDDVNFDDELIGCNVVLLYMDCMVALS